MPSSRRTLAPVGQASTHAGFSHCTHAFGTYARPLSPACVPHSYTSRLFHDTPGRWLFCIWHATTHAPHPAHRRRSMAIPYLVIPSSFLPGAAVSARASPGELYAGPRASSRSARNNRFPYFALPRGWRRHHRFLAYARFKRVKGTGDLTHLNLVGDERHVCQIARPFDTRHTLFDVGGKPPQVIVLSWGFTMQRGWPIHRERESWQPSKSIDPS